MPDVIDLHITTVWCSN